MNFENSNVFHYHITQLVSETVWIRINVCRKKKGGTLRDEPLTKQYITED